MPNYIILLPPSEGKAPGGDDCRDWTRLAADRRLNVFCEMNLPRRAVINALQASLSQPTASLSKLFSVKGERLDEAVETNGRLPAGPLLPAIHPVLAALGHDYTVQVALSTPQGTKHPDYILCADDRQRTFIQTHSGPLTDADLAGALAVADAKAWNRSLDRGLPGGNIRTLHENPGLQIDFYIRHAGLDWGVLTNGRLWRLYHGESSRKLDVYYEVDLPALLAADDTDAFKYFWLFFRRQAFVAGAHGPRRTGVADARTGRKSTL